MTNKTLSVSAIKDGTVIDHIAAGQALKIINLLNLANFEQQITLGLNLTSKNLGKKDLIKIENKFFLEEEANQIILLAPLATINVIENFVVVRKIISQLPNHITKILTCANKNCITYTEQVASSFFVSKDAKNIYLECKYCEKKFERDFLVNLNYK